MTTPEPEAGIAALPDDAVVSFNSETIALIGRISTVEKCDKIVATLKAMRPFLRQHLARAQGERDDA